MKIAFVTDDHQTISAHFVRAIYYEVFTIAEGKITQREALLLKQAGIQPIMTDIKGISPDNSAISGTRVAQIAATIAPNSPICQITCEAR